MNEVKAISVFKKVKEEVLKSFMYFIAKLGE